MAPTYRESQIPAGIPPQLASLNQHPSTYLFPPTMCPEDEQTTELQQALAENPLQADVSIECRQRNGICFDVPRMPDVMMIPFMPPRTSLTRLA